ncbi:MAG: hypothetical protein RLZZ66_1417 [Pseudomonadota bacterium]|jgi:hypothetical protein
MIKQRIPKSEKDLQKIEDNFIKSVDVTSLSDLSLDDLANRYYEIHCQSHLMKGLILLEARNRFSSNNEFGDWVQSVQSICLDSQPVRTRLMNYAKYFKEKDITGISLSACYEISAPVNEDVADKVYEYALNRNLSVTDIKAKIKEEKKLLPILESNAEEDDQDHESFTEADHDTNKKEELMPREDVSEFVKLILSDVQSLPQNEAVRVLKLCLKELNKHSADGVTDAKP